MNLRKVIDESIEPADVTVDEFGDIVIYLMDHGVICRDDSVTEREMYDRYVRVKEEVAEYLSVIGVPLYHNEEFASVRAYAPDSVYPKSNEIKEEGSSLMRLPIGKELAASLLVAYLLYDQKRREGLLQDDFTAVVHKSEFLTAHSTMLGIGVDASRNKTSRDEIYKAMRRLRAVAYHKEFLASDEYPLIIRPLIYDIVPEESAKAVLEMLEKEPHED